MRSPHPSQSSRLQDYWPRLDKGAVDNLYWEIRVRGENGREEII